ncbi:hypothetical protein WJX74_006465 [Apatococcus lobatus]|uniref:Fungal lipase-type domain-containing protein n=1 Tax=Apatococcus lobatus TaxID=904363 RepID=A0AAW1Q771_9CHLO
MTFEHDEILECAILAQKAYDGSFPDEDVRCFSDPKTDCQCYVVERARTAFVVFRGTSSLEDAVMDCDVCLEPFPVAGSGDVHAGFLDQTEAVIARVDDALREWKGEIRCCGHSMGAADAAIAALWLALRYAGDPLRPVGYIGFGCPRVGDRGWKETYESHVTRSVRVKNGRDPVPGVPSRAPFVHVGDEMHVGRADPHPDIPSLLAISDHDATTGYVAHCTEDDTAAAGVNLLQYALLFVANRFVKAARR